MAAHGLQILHAIPGRLRLKVGTLKDNPALADECQGRLARLWMVQQAVVNPVTGSVLVTYDPRLLEAVRAGDLSEFGDMDVLQAMQELLALGHLLGSSPQDVDRNMLEDWLRVHPNGSQPAATTVAAAVETFFGKLNTQVAQASNGWGDLPALVPLSLFFLGVRSLLLVETVPFPAWYDYFWFAFGTYIALHPRGVS
jgi:hypothetical protein